MAGGHGHHPGYPAARHADIDRRQLGADHDQANRAGKVSVRDRDTIILGGFISTTKTKDKSGVPILKDIPGLGYLFRSTQDANKRVELIVMIRPTVLPSPGDAALVATQQRNHMPGVRAFEAEYQADEARRVKEGDRAQQKRDAAEAKKNR